MCSIFVIVDSGDVCTDKRGLLNMFLYAYIAPLNIQNSRWYPYGKHDKYKKCYIQTDKINCA